MFTVVTGFFDIGRGEWQHYTRKLDSYLRYFANMLSLKVNMIIFIEPKFVNFVESNRNYTNYKTIIIPTDITNLHMYQYLERITEIQNKPEYSTGHPNVTAPEICQPLYNVVTCSKMHLLAEATKIDTESDYFIWLDAGYTHNTMDLSILDWNPTCLFEHSDKFSVITLQSLAAASEDPREFFLQYIDVLIGGFMGGYRDTINKIKDLYYDLVLEMFELDLKDDDQFYNTILAKRHPELFNVIQSTWYGAMTFV